MRARRATVKSVLRPALAIRSIVLLFTLSFSPHAGAEDASAKDEPAGVRPGEPAVRAPLVIAHRGSSGYLPEHTLPAYTLAHAQGADYIETDILMTKDRALVALHDHRLDYNTNVRELFPKRARHNGHWYAADFTLEEVRRLAVHGNRPGRFRRDSRAFRIPTFQEIIELVQELNRLTGRDVGLYVETKVPAFHERNDLPLEEAMLDTLRQYGYRGADANIYMESFEANSLKKLRYELGAALRLTQLISPISSYDPMVTDAGLDEIAKYAQVIGLVKTRVEDDPTLVLRAQSRGLAVHAFTFRADDVPDVHASFAAEVGTFYFDYGVDGLFTDHTDRVLTLRDAGPSAWHAR